MKITEIRAIPLAVPLQPVGPADVPHLARVGQLDPHDEQVGRRAVEREAARVRATVLHGLKHPGHLAADIARPGAVNDACDAAHVANPSRPARPR